MITNWQTTVGGISLIVMAISQALWAYFDGNAQTHPNYDLMMSQIIAGIALIRAVDIPIGRKVLKTPQRNDIKK